MDKFFIISEADKPFHTGQIIAEITKKSYLVEVNDETTYVMEFFPSKRERDRALDTVAKIKHGK